MATDSNYPKNGGGNEGNTVITKNTKLVGDITLEGELHLNGTLEGNLSSYGSVSISSSGYVNGDIDAQIVYISGKVLGNIKAKEIFLLSGCMIEGDLSSDSLSIEPHAVINGKLNI